MRALPAGEAVLVVPATETPLKQVVRSLVPHLRAPGWHNPHTLLAATEAFAEEGAPGCHDGTQAAVRP